MSISLRDFHHDLFQDVYNHSDSTGIYPEDAFFEHATDLLVEAGEFETAERAHFEQRGLRVDGYGGDPLANEHTLSLIVADFSGSPQIRTLTATDMSAIFNRVENFLKRSLDSSFRYTLEETSPAFGLAQLISRRWGDIAKVRLFLITNRQLSSRVDGRAAGKHDGTPVTFSVWDVSRIYRFVTSRGQREELEIDLRRDFGGAIPALPAYVDDDVYEAYLAVLSGKQLADIYDRWGTRLLEQNVRVFLQARGNVNRGIRSTLDHEPEMFFAYNNGITATAERVDTEKSDAGVFITGIKNLQIVNGGQTTASIHAKSLRSGGDLEGVFVQMKLSIIESERAMDVIPKISEYANSQNRVNAADFFSNHPFHVRMENFSRRIWAPAPDGSFLESKWFYERARGQYQDARANLSTPDRRKFDNEYPRKQVFNKTDLAKFANVWRGLPHVVSRGAQKNFAEFAQYVGKAWEQSLDSFGEDYFREVVAKAIVFRQTERIVSSQPWYEGGYRANVVAYTIAKLANDAESQNVAVDFRAIWGRQGVCSSLEKYLSTVSEAVHQIIVEPPSGTANVTEWAKQEACWGRVKQLRIDLEYGSAPFVVTKGEVRNRRKRARTEQRLLSGIEAQTAVVNAGSQFWRSVISWGSEEQLLDGKEIDILRVAAEIPAKLPSEKQSEIALRALKRLEAAGFRHNHIIAV